MTTNREQHELAARAAGLPLLWKTGSCKGGEIEAAFVGDQPWRPKEDDGDALRLAVRLKIELLHNAPNEQPLWVSAVVSNTILHGAENFENELDRLSRTRLAIFRAAVEIGKALP